MLDNVLIDQPRHSRWRWYIVFWAVCFFPAVSAAGLAFSQLYLPPVRVERMAMSAGDIAASPPIHTPAPLVPLQADTSTPPTNFTAASIVVKDHASGAMLFGKQEYTKRPLASITKLMSALVLLDAHPRFVSTTVVVADAVEDTHMYAGDTYTIDELWHAALIGSSNKAILTLVDASGLTRVDFVRRMNDKAKLIGLTDTLFVEPTGLDDGNRSTASDIALLLQEAMNNSAIRQTLATPEYRLFSRERRAGHHIWNTDWLLLGWIPHTFARVLGGKTGYTPAAGYNVALELEDKAGRKLDVVILGASTHEARFTEARDIAQWVFTHFAWH